MKLTFGITISEATDAKRENGRTLPSTAYAELRNRWPQYFFEGLTAFKFEALEDDPIVSEVISFLRSHGREPYRKKQPSLMECENLWLTHYQVLGRRIFEGDDFVRAELFYFVPSESMAEDFEISDGGYYRIPQRAIAGAKIGSLLGYRLPVCSDSLKRLMEAEEFAGLTFQHVEISECRKPIEPLWKLASDRTMPPVLNHLVTVDGHDFDASKHRDCWPDDDYYPWLLRFPETAVRAMGSFDAALTSDRFGIPLDHILIVSRRFRDWCNRRKLKLTWYPVALE